MEQEIVAGWYADPDGKPCSRYWSGEAWTDQTRPLPQMLDSISQAAPQSESVSYSRASGAFHGDYKSLVRLAVRAIADLGWTVIGSDEMTSSVRFETKMSWGSWSGVTCNLTFVDETNGQWRVVGTGKQNVRGMQLVAFDNGEAKKKAAKAIARMQELAPAVD